MQLMPIKVGLLSVPLLKTSVREKGGLGGFAPQTLTRSYYFEPPLSKKRSRATAPDLAPCDFFLFPMLKRPLKGRRVEIKINATKELKGIKTEAYLDCFRKEKHRWDKCVRWEGEYFEGDPDLQLL